MIFLLHLAPLATASTILLSGEEAFAQMKSFQLQTPRQNQSFAVGEQVQIAALIKTQYPRLQRVDFRANGQLIGSGTWRSPRITWTPANAGNYIITAEAISQQGGILSTATTNVSILTVLYDKIGGPGDWRYLTEPFIESTFDSTDFGSSRVITCYIGNSNIVQILRRLEVVAAAVNVLSSANIPFSSFPNFLFRVWLGVPAFDVSPLSGSVGNHNLGQINFGNISSQLFTNSLGIRYYLFGWNDLNIELPANQQLVLSLQAEGQTDGDRFLIAGATSGPLMRQADVTLTGPNLSWNIPISVRLLTT